VTEADRIAKAIDIAKSNGTNDGAHHKMWVIDQMVRALAGCPTVTRSGRNCFGEPYEYQMLDDNDQYLEFVREHNQGEDGPNTYCWDVGIPP
jgi:hypothetical protein